MQDDSSALYTIRYSRFNVALPYVVHQARLDRLNECCLCPGFAIQYGMPPTSQAQEIVHTLEREVKVVDNSLSRVGYMKFTQKASSLPVQTIK